jgi:hypothetical protein
MAAQYLCLDIDPYPVIEGMRDSWEASSSVTFAARDFPAGGGDEAGEDDEDEDDDGGEIVGEMDNDQGAVVE